MNKSKFLKKSLAAILAVMLIVAMIPLGASAAGLPTLTAIDIGGSTVEADGTVFKADIANAATTVDVTATVGMGATLTAIALADGDDVVITTNTTTTLTLAKFQADGATASKVTIPLSLVSSDNKQKVSYSIELTRTTQKTTTELSSVTIANQIGDAVVNNANRTVAINVPKSRAIAGAISCTVKTKDGATWDGNASGAAANVTFTAGVGQITVTSESGGNTEKYTIVLTEVPILTNFTVDGVAGTIDQDAKTIAVELPGSILLDDDGNKLTNSDAIKVPFAFTKAYGDATVEIPTGTAFTSGTKVDVNNKPTGALTKPGVEKYQTTVTVTYLTIPTTYALTVTYKKSSENGISAATVAGEEATVAGTQITADLAKGTALTSLGGSFTVPEDATISMIANKTSVVLNPGTPAAGTVTYTYAGANLSNGAAVTVAAADGTTKTYTLKVTANAVVNEPTIYTLTLKDPKGNEVKGIQNGNTFTFTVPYMTIDLTTWKVFYTGTTNTVYQDATNAAVTSGANVNANLIGAAANLPLTGSVGKITAISKSDVTAKHEYTIIVKLADPVNVRKENVKLTGVNAAYGTAVVAYDKVTSANTRVAKPSNDGTNDIYTTTIPFSASKTTLVSLTTTNNGVVFLKTSGAYATTPVVATDAANKVTGAELKDGDTLLVLPEVAARAAIVASTVNAALGNEYVYKISNDAASSEKRVRSLKFGDTSITLSADSTVSLPYGITVDAGNEAAATAVFPEFELYHEFATLKDGTTAITFVSEGADADSDGAVDAISATNGAVQLVRQLDGSVKVYATKAANGAPEAAPITTVVVVAEDGTVATYNLPKFVYAQPNTTATITSFKLAGVNGTVSGTKISVTVPYGTKLTALTPTYTTSSGATVTYSGSPIKSGEAVIDFTNDVVLKVTSEDGKVTVPYTVSVVVASQFSDVPESAWYYKDVMTAASNGWVSGTGDGQFTPNGSMKRGDFAIMIANVMNADLTKYPNSAFPDVESTKYYSAAIAFCADKGYISGDAATGHFNPEATITREQMARILCDAKGLSKVSEPAKKFNDDAKISSWAKGYVYACAQAGIFVGDTNGNFIPGSNAKRSEAAAVLVRAFN